jgi:MFS family permease
MTGKGNRSTWTSILSPFRYKTYAVIWTATLISNIGGWMYSSSAGWLMTTLDSDPLMVSLVQVAASLPMFLFALPAGALADIIDKRRFLIGAELFIGVACVAFALGVTLHLITPKTLLLFIFVIEAGSAASAPAWQAVVPQLVPNEALGPAVAMNSVGVNVSRAIGPALSGLLTVSMGIAAPFWVNAFSNLGTLGALGWWREPAQAQFQLPAEHFTSAIRTGVRHAKNNRNLRATLVRAVGFFLPASCYWALLPLVAGKQVGGGAALYGTVLGTIGVSAIAGAFALPALKARWGTNRLVAAGALGTGIALALLGSAHTPAPLFAASILAGVTWIVVLANLNISAQVALPEWVRGRGLAIYVTVFFGTLTVGSVVWGQVARLSGIPTAHYIASGLAFLAVAVTWRWQLQSASGIDLRPSMHWPSPIVTEKLQNDAGPVLVLVEYHIAVKDRDAFLEAVVALSHERGRDGAYAWSIYEDVSKPGRMVEAFYVESWLEHLRQHNRVTNADRILEQNVRRVSLNEPKTTHLVSARRD